MELKIKLLDEKCKPIRGTKESAGLDLKARIDKPITIPPGETIKFPSGIIAEIPNGHFGGIYARSGLAIKQGVRIANSVGRQ